VAIQRAIFHVGHSGSKTAIASPKSLTSWLLKDETCKKATNDEKKKITGKFGKHTIDCSSLSHWGANGDGGEGGGEGEEDLPEVRDREPEGGNSPYKTLEGGR